MKIKNWFKKILKIVGILLLLVIISFSILFYRIFRPLSDEEILEKFETESVQPTISYIDYKGKKVRVVHMQKVIDTTLATLVFVHGSPGSLMDFKRYLKDEDLNKKANIISYDRVGYGENNRGEILNSIEEEVELLHKIIENLNPDKLILIGYSYGGTTVLASPKKINQKMLLAAAVKGDLEPMFWALNLYKWKLTRPFVPKIFQAATQEKLRHIKELKTFEKVWNQSDAKVISIHGSLDRIVPYENSLFLTNIFDKDKFTLITLEKGTHSLIWTNFEIIKNEILKVIVE